MALTKQDALKMAMETTENSNAARARYETLCGLWLCYAYGPQWAQKNNSANLSSSNLSYLKPVISPKSRKVRIAMNMIQPRIERTNARLMPRELDFVAKPASRASNDTIASMVATTRLEQQTDDVAAVKALRRASLWRCVLGSGVIKRTMQPVGAPIVVRGPDGQPRMDGEGEPKTVKTFRNKWVVCPPYEFIRDASARTTDFEDEQIIGHECPRTTDWLKRNYNITVDAKGTMGELLEFQRFLYTACGQTSGQGFGESKQNGVLVSEWWFKDPSHADGENHWPWRLMAYRDTRSEVPEDRQLKALEFGPNPYHQLPLHHLIYDTQLISPWGIGIPAKTIPAQDSYNIAHTSMLRSFVSHGSPTWVVKQNTLVDGEKDGLNPRADKPIVWYGSDATSAPKRLESAAIDSTVRQILSDSPSWLDNMLNQSPVQVGEAVKRGESKSAYEFRKDSADMSQTAILDEDELTYNQLLTGTMHDLIKSETTKVLVNRLSHQYTVQQILTLKQQDVAESLAGVKIVRETLRPRTSLETKEDFLAAIQSQIIDPIAARRSMLVKKGISFDEKEKLAYEAQILELAALLNGDEVEVFLAEEHEMHMYTLELEINSPMFRMYSEDQQEAIQGHWTEHKEKQQMKLQLDEPLPQIPEESAPPEQPMPGEQAGMGMGQELGLPVNALAGPLPTPQMPMGGMGQMLGLGGIGEGMPSELGLPQTGAAPMAQMPSVPVGAGL